MSTDKQTNVRLLKTYGRTLEWYEHELKKQNGKCAICHKEPTVRRLHVDHDHSHRYVKITSTKLMGGYWRAEGEYNGEHKTFLGFSKSEAIKAFRSWAKTNSTRGLLCWPCNRALQSYRDNPELMEKAAKYLRKFQCQNS